MPKNKNSILIFDIDGVLGNFDKLRIARKNKYLSELSEERRISLSKAQRLFNKTKRSLIEKKRYSTIDVMWTLGFDKSHYYSLINDVPVQGKVIPSSGCKQFIKKYSSQYHVVALTNTPYAIAKKTLQHMDLLQYFDRLYCIDNASFVKPSVSIYYRILRDFKVKDGFSIGDSVEKDLIPAKKAGLKTVLFEAHVSKRRGVGNKVDFRVDDFKELGRVIIDSEKK